MDRKYIGAVIILACAIAALFFLWQFTWPLTLLLTTLAYIKHRLYPIAAELAWFMLICVGGSIVEIILVNGAGAWSYTSSQLLNIPVWMPVFWGLVGTTIIVLYEDLVKRKR